MKRRVVSIFSGIDCLGLGAREFFDTVLAVDEDSNPCKVLNANKDKFHPNMEVWNRNICDISDDEILAFKGVDGVMGGPPCQSFSSARGGFNPDDERNNYIFEYLRWVRLIEPKFFLFENVEGLVQKGKVHLFHKFLDDADSLGYKVSYKVVNAHDYGSAQARLRIIVVGFRNDLGLEFVFPNPVENKKYVRDILDTNITGEHSKASARLREIMPHIPEGGYWKHLKSEELLKKALGKNYEKRAGGMTGVCRRLHRDKPAPTLVTSPTQNTTLLYHPVENRPLSVTEYKRGQGIPLSYDLSCISVTAQYRAIGNGVPVEMSYEITKAISNTLDTILDDFDTNKFDNDNNTEYLYDVEIACNSKNQLCFVF